MSLTTAHSVVAPSANSKRIAGAIIIAYALFLGFVSIPVAVLSGMILPEPTLLAPVVPK